MTINRVCLDELEVIIPNLKKRYSGVTAVNRSTAPLIATLCHAAWFGADAPEGIRSLTLRDLIRLRFLSPRHPSAFIWHARRNTEMLLGLVLRSLGWRMKIIFSSAGQREKSRYTRFLIDRMDAIIATSEISASFVHRPSTPILHGIDVDLYSPPVDREAAFAATGLPGRYGVGIFGRVRRQKGVDLFVEAMCRLLPRYPDFTAVVIGFISANNRAFVEDLKQRIAAAGLADRVRFLGELPVDDVPNWYKRISIYVFASRVEGFGLTILEAMSAGAAVVAARAGAAEIAIIDGDTGMLVPVDSVDDLTAALEPLMQTPSTIPAMGARARDRVVKNFSRNREAEEIVGVYRRLWRESAS